MIVLTKLQTIATVISVLCLSPTATAQQSKEDLAKEIANPITSVTTVPFQFDYDSNIGPGDDGDRFSLNIQPLISFSINDDWAIISRTILPLVTQNNVSPGVGSQSGLGDVLQSVFVSPELPTEGGWIWGAGPVFLLPTASDDLLGAGKFGVGPTAIVLKQTGPWTGGVLANHVWSVAGDDDRQDINLSFAQPFLDYTTKSAITFEITTETTYDWKSEQWSVPLVVTANKLIEVGNQLVMVGGGPRYWMASTDSDPEGWSVNLQIILLFPKE